MTQTASNYGRVLFELGIEKNIVEETARIFSLTPELLRELLNPTISKDRKRKIIRKIFPKEIQNFLCVLSDYQRMDQIHDILEAYKTCYQKEHHVIAATLYYVTKPTEQQEEGIKNYIGNQFHGDEVELNLIQDLSLIGGFVIRVGDMEIDQSLRGRMNELKQRLVWR